MKNTFSSIVRWAGRAAIAAAILPFAAKAAIFDVTSASARRIKTYTTGETIGIVLELDIDDASGLIDTTTIPEGFGFRFALQDGTVRVASFAANINQGGYGLLFQYVVQPEDYSVGIFSVDDVQFAGSLLGIKNQAGIEIGGIMSMIEPQPYGNMIPLEDQDDNDNLKINPENASIFKINFLDEYGEQIAANTTAAFVEGQEAVRYVVNIGAKPPAGDPVTVTINWGVANVFAEEDSTILSLTEAETIVTIEKILDDGAEPVATSKHNYTIHAVREGYPDATMLASVQNVAPEISGFFGSVGLTTNTALAVDQEISVTVQVEDIAGELDDPLNVTWRFGSRTPTSVNTQWMGTYWESTAIGTIPEGYSTISVSVYDKDRGGVATNALIFAEAGPLLKATVATTMTEGLNNLGDGTIEIVQPGSGSIAWDPDYGNHLPTTATRAILRANAYTSAEADDMYDSFYYKWYNEEDEGLEKNDHTRGLKAGYEPISRDATVNLLADDSAPAADRAPMDRVVQYYFSRELYRPDNFGDIDGDRLGDEWEIRWFSQTARNFTDPVSGEFVRPAESGAPVRADQATILFDFSGSGNMDGDGLPANCFANTTYTVDQESESIPVGAYSIQTFAYPLPANSVRQYGYMPLGGNHMVSRDEESDIVAFRANTYVNQGSLKNIFVDFNNELEFRGVGLYNGFVDEAGETINFRPINDGDDPNTDPMNSDTDGDGLPDGWEYYFWAVAYYNIGSDQWLAFNGAAPSGGSYLGTGDPISREDILNTFNPTSASFVDEDLDHDGLTNLQEFALGTNPIHWDTDGDGLPDGWEVEFGVIDNGESSDDDEEVSTATLVLNPLKPDGDYNDDGDWFAIDGTIRHYDVFLAYDFDPRVAWCDPRVQTVTYAGTTYNTSYPYTDKFTALEEFNLGAWYVEHGSVGALQGIDSNAANYWGKWTTDPREPDTDGDGIPDGWEAYVSLNANDAKDASADADNDSLNNLHEFLCVMAAEQYPYIADGYQGEIDEWPNKPWPTNPNGSVGEGYAHGADTDNDQVLDGYEKGPNVNPTSCDTDRDYLPDFWECYYGTDPLVRDSFMDYDGDGLQNWQEYLTGAVWHWQYDKWYNAFRGSTGPGEGDVQMFDFLVDPEDATGTYGGFGRGPHGWDCAATTADGYDFYFLSAEVRNTTPSSPKLLSGTAAYNNPGYTRSGVAEDRTAGAVTYATTAPWNVDSDSDGMDDFYEAFHGLNPLYGGSMLGNGDIVGMTDDVTGDYYPSTPWDLTVYPWLSGDPNADPDKDGLSSLEECADLSAAGGSHHTDPSPYWLTDTTYERSFASLYYQPGDDLSDNWYFGNSAPTYVFSFETNEGYDTDNDNVGDRSEVTTDELSSKADPLDFDNPRRRKAMYFNGIDAACRTRGTISENDFSTFTVEAWICPVNPAAGRIQTIIERAAVVPQDTAKGDISGKRINFRLSITEIGTLHGEFHNYQGAHVTMETDVANTGLRAGVWSHVAMTYSGSPADSGYLTIYVNGVSKKAVASSLQAFSNVASPIVIGASDSNPDGVVDGMSSDSEPELTDYFYGWMDEVRIWSGARSAEGIRATMSKRFDRDDVAAWSSASDKIAVSAVSLRHHYTFDSLPDPVPATDRDPAAYLFPSDIESLPVGFAEVFTAPNDGSYPGVPWWNASAYVNYRYDTRHIPWIEDSVLHTGDGTIVDSPHIVAVTDDAGNVAGYREYSYSATFASPTNRVVTRTVGDLVASFKLPNGRNPYGTGYNAPVYGENLTWSVGTTSTTNVTVDANGVTNTTTFVDATGTVTYGGYSSNEGAVESGNSSWEFADLLPLGGAVADIDVALWDGQGVGYELVTVDTDGDGIPDYWETLYGLDPFNASDAWGDPDADGLDNLAEYRSGTNPAAADTDGDGYPDYNDRDTDKSLTYGEQFDDHDGMPSWWENLYGLNPRVYDASTDLDGDGWSNYSEYLAGTDPANANLFPVPPLLANIHYDGDKSDGTLVVYAFSDTGVIGKPDAVYTQPVQAKGAGALTVDREFLATIHDGVAHYEGQVALGNIVDGSFTLQGYSTEALMEQALTFTTTTDPAAFYCTACGTMYTPAQIIETGDAATPYICQHGHTDILAATGYSSRLTSNAGTGHIDYTTGKWYVDITGFPPDVFAGYTLVASYSSEQGSAFSFPMRRKWTSNVDSTSGLIAAGHLREGNNVFFGFLDLDGDLLFDEGEPAGMALYSRIPVSAGPVEIEIPLTDFLTGFPRFSWEPVENVGGYSVTLTTASGASILSGYAVPADRTYVMEQDFLSGNGVNLGSAANSIINWKVQPIYGDYNPGASANTAPAIASGAITNSVSNTSRGALSIQYPSMGVAVSEASIPVRWTMDYRNEGVQIVLRNTDTGTEYLNKVCALPRRVGPLNSSNYYTYEIQKALGNGTFIDLPDGNYTLTLTENIKSSAVTAKTASVNFVVDHDGVDSSATADGLGSISGTVSYYGKIPFTIQDETLATFDGATTTASAALSRSPVPGTVTVKIVSGNTTLFTASDIGAREGMPNQALYSTSEDILAGSYVTYGEAPAVALELATAPVSGARLVASYTQYECPIRIQAFRCTDGPTFSGAPAAQTTLTTKGVFTLEGLPAGTYCLRAFIDQDRNNVLTYWESVGYAMAVVRTTVGIENFATFDVPPGAMNVEITIADRDTDSDRLPDSWEYYYYQRLSTQGGDTENKVGVYLWQEYADGELDSNPLIEDTDGDGLPDAVEYILNSDNHNWDTDGDGVGDLEEFLAGSDPADAASVSRFAAPAPTFLADGTPALELETPALIKGFYIQYQLLAKDTLDAPWSVADTSALIGISKDSDQDGIARGTVTVKDPVAAGAAFYKVKVLFESDTILDR